MVQRSYARRSSTCHYFMIFFLGVKKYCSIFETNPLNLSFQKVEIKNSKENFAKKDSEISLELNVLNFLIHRDIQKRPEFLAKQHQLKSSALKKQAEKDKEENNELFAKLKSRSQVIDQVKPLS